jgi:Fe2+ transport system protein FeoA
MFKKIDKKTLSLSEMSIGKKLSVVSLEGGRGFKDKMFSQGIIPGAVIKLISGGKSSPLIVQIHGTRICVGYEMAKKIIVKE